MKRRAILAGAVGLFAVTPCALTQERVRVVGYLTHRPGVTAFSMAMAKLGWVEGRNVRYDVRVVARDGSGAEEAAEALVRSAPDVLVAETESKFALPLARATRTIPIVIGGVSDPVEHGLAHSLQQPGMNVTGMSLGMAESAMLQLGMLRTLVPGLRRVLFITTESDTVKEIPKAHRDAGASLGLSVEQMRIRDEAAFERMLGSIRHPAAEAMWVALLPPGLTPGDAAAAAIQRRIATHGLTGEYVRAGFLMSYWRRNTNRTPRMAALVDKILRGADPARIPFELPDSIEFTLNRATAKAIGLALTPDLLVRATEVVD